MCMKIWAAIRTDGKIQQDIVMEFSDLSQARVEDWGSIIGELCHALDLARPVLLKKHLHDLVHFCIPHSRLLISWSPLRLTS